MKIFQLSFGFGGTGSKNALKLVIMVIQLCEYTKLYTELYTLEG